MAGAARPAEAGEERTIRAAVIGLGMMGRNHVRVLDELPGVELAAVADPDPEALRRATTGRAARGYADHATMLVEEQLDMVTVVAPTSLHRPAALAAIEAGLHVLVEKPIASTRDEAEEMIGAAERAGRILSVGHIERFNPAIRELRRRLAAGEIGRVFQVKATRLGPFPARIRDVGVVVDLATHDLDIMRFLLGSDPIRLYAETERKIHTDHEDLFVGIVKFANGAVGLLDVNWLTPAKRRTLTVTGERGMFVADYINQDLFFYANPDAELTWENRGPDAIDPPITSVAEGEMTRLRVRRQEPLAVELGEFADAVRNGRRAPVDPRDAMVAMLLARKMVESGETGLAVSGTALEEALT